MEGERQGEISPGSLLWGDSGINLSKDTDSSTAEGKVRLFIKMDDTTPNSSKINGFRATAPEKKREQGQGTAKKTNKKKGPKCRSC